MQDLDDAFENLVDALLEISDEIKESEVKEKKTRINVLIRDTLLKIAKNGKRS